MAYIRWGGKKFYPQKPKPYKADINELMKPLSEKAHKGNVWGSVITNVQKDTTPVPPPSPSATPIPASPTPTPTTTQTSSPTPTPSITPTSTLTPTPTPSATPPVVFEAEYQAVLDYATLQGYTLPSYSVQLLQNSLVADLKTNGNWSDMDIMYVPAGDGDEDFASINWIDPEASFNLTIGGGMTYSGNTGFVGNDTNGYLETSFVPSTRARGNNADVSMGGWFLNPEDTLIGSFATTYRQHILPDSAASTFYAAYVGTTESPNAGAITLSNGLWVVDNSGTESRLYRNETLLNSFTQSGGSLSTVSLGILARHRGSGVYDFYSNSNCLFAFHGARNATNGLYTLINNYITSL